MINLKSKYKPLLFPVGIVYLYFYLMFQFFHHHETHDKEMAENQKFHSHVLNFEEEHHSKEHKNFSSIDVTSHYQHHFAKYYSLDFTATSKKSVQSFADAASCSQS